MIQFDESLYHTPVHGLLLKEGSFLTLCEPVPPVPENIYQRKIVCWCEGPEKKSRSFDSIKPTLPCNSCLFKHKKRKVYQQPIEIKGLFLSTVLPDYLTIRVLE